MKIRITLLSLVYLFVIISLLASCASEVNKKETTVQIPQTVSDVPKITVDELIQLIESDNIVIVDVRDEEEYLEAHIKGAISVPLPAIDTQEWEPPRDKAFILY